MIRTQVQLPDDLYAETKRAAANMEISLAELVRRGLEYMLSVGPSRVATDKWSLPEPGRLGGRDPFTDPGWRERIHTGHLRVAEDSRSYGKENRG